MNLKRVITNLGIHNIITDLVYNNVSKNNNNESNFKITKT